MLPKPPCRHFLWHRGKRHSPYSLAKRKRVPGDEESQRCWAPARLQAFDCNKCPIPCICTNIECWMSGWAEKNNVLTDLPNRFRADRYLEDNLFVLVQTIAVAPKEYRDLYGCFLDMAKA
ncbi:hypothetical protein MRX96_019321 [Rhipicephalus microplus]